MTNPKRYYIAPDTLAGVVENDEGDFVRYDDIKHLLAVEPKAEPIYGSLTARDPSDVTRSAWTKTGWWLPAEGPKA